MRMRYDEKADALYLRLIGKTVEDVFPGLNTSSLHA